MVYINFSQHDVYTVIKNHYIYALTFLSFNQFLTQNEKTHTNFKFGFHLDFYNQFAGCADHLARGF